VKCLYLKIKHTSELWCVAMVTEVINYWLLLINKSKTEDDCMTDSSENPKV
jgi:hypothetical protein